MAVIGDLCEAENKVKFEWKIKDFSSLSQKIDKYYCSPSFYFSSSSWHISIYLNGQTRYKSEGWIGLYLYKDSNVTFETVDYDFRISETIKIGELEKLSFTFGAKKMSWGYPKYCSKRTIMEKKSDVLPSDVLTITCTINNNTRMNITRSLFCRYREISDNLKKIYNSGSRSDILLKINGQDIPAHRNILETSSPVFAAMLKHDTKENQTGEIIIDDFEKSTMEMILEFIYSGDIKELLTENVLSVYAAAEKYDLKYVKDMCLDFIKRNISEEWVYDIIKFADLYQVEEISCSARAYFEQNARKILKTDRWKAFAKENPNISLELLSSVVLSLLPEK